jgi:dTDP-4-dehydrorhamnose reductase
VVTVCDATIEVILNIVVVGRSGQISWELQHLLTGLGQLTVVGRPETDLASPAPLCQSIRQSNPDVIVNAAAYTAVDQAEAEPDLATAINAEAPRLMAEEAKRLKALFIHYSTDYVYDGTKASAYSELDTARPLNMYGTSKLAGDRAIESVGGSYLIFRTSWIYGPRGKNFLLTIMKLAAERDELRVVNDQIGAPTSSRDVAQATKLVISKLTAAGQRLDSLGDRRGIYNMTTQGSVSWCGFATAILEEMCRRVMNQGPLARIVPISTAERLTAAVRPKNSCLANEKILQTFGVALPDWNTSLVAVMEEIAGSRSSRPN